MKTDYKQIILLGDFMKTIVKQKILGILIILTIGLLILLKVNTSNDTVKPKSATFVKIAGCGFIG